jgi:hypothetical protein
MNGILLKSLIAFVPVSMLLAGSVALFLKARNLHSSLQMGGSAFLGIVTVTHICEALHLFPAMGWGLEHSAGHYLDFSSAVLGLTLFPLGYLFNALKTDSVRKS